jgi:hypothetical protein
VTAELSYVIPCGTWRHVARVVDCLLAQEEAGRIELVLAGPAALEGEVPPHVRERFAAVTIVPAVPEKMHEARAAGLLAAAAPLAVIGETHCYPRPGWARALLAAFAEGTWDAIGPQIENANPRTGMSWANIALDYGPFLRPERGEADSLPGQNAAVRTALLERYRDGLGARMRMPYVFFEELRANGARLLVEPAMRSAHLNVTDPHGWLLERVGVARLFAADRSAGWPRRRRALYALAAPAAVPVLRARRALRDLRRAGGPLRALAPLVAALLASGIGEAVGYAVGRGPGEPRIFVVELDREAYAPR